MIDQRPAAQQRFQAVMMRFAHHDLSHIALTGDMQQRFRHVIPRRCHNLSAQAACQRDMVAEALGIRLR